MEPMAFFNKMYPSAKSVVGKLNLPCESLMPVLLAQWAHESGWESDSWVGHNNYSGITDGGPPNFLQYPTIDDFAQDHARVLNMSYYAAVRAAAAAGLSAETVAVLLGVSPWDAGHYLPSDGKYAGVPGGYLLNIMEKYQLTTYTPADQVDTDEPSPAEPAPDLPDPEFAPAVSWAIANGISDGTSPHAPATRQQVMAMMYRYSGGKV